ncbi:hypothetical protein H4S06_001517 [Coemansia sp. BCRC 34490]|nr:hypothetical protein LPJ72_002848 [Coemansia sp. Benny D160-2]KAJ2760849.1 hypothetical protein H4S06_001517 [Coemansia sp. BCRC 34490]
MSPVALDATTTPSSSPPAYDGRPRQYSRGFVRRGAGAVSELLQRSPFYTDDCDLYPQRMREVMNQRDTTVIQQPRTQQQQNERPVVVPAMDLQSILEIYPGIARLVQQQ